jgi:hypothetical protein
MRAKGRPVGWKNRGVGVASGQMRGKSAEIRSYRNVGTPLQVVCLGAFSGAIFG